MKAKITTAFVYIFTVLLTKLCFDFVIYIMPVIQSTKNAYYDVLIGMLLTVVVFYPMYGGIHSLVEKLSNWFIKTENKRKKSYLIKLFIVFLILNTLLFAGFMKIKRDINIFQDLYNNVNALM